MPKGGEKLEGSQSILFKKDFVNPASIFLPEEVDALASVAEHLCNTLPNARNPFSLGIGTRRFSQADLVPQLELVLSFGQPDYCKEELQQILQMAAQPRNYLSGLSNALDYYDQGENALKNGVVIHSDGAAFSSVKDDGGWFVLGLKFKHTLSLESNVFAVAFLAGIIGTIFAMDDSNGRLRAGYYAFLSTCENWSATPPEVQLRAWLNKSSFKDFACRRYEHHGPRNFFG